MVSGDSRQLACLGAAGVMGSLIIGAAAFPAHAQPPQQRPITVTAERSEYLTERVPFHDLSLASRQGRHELTRRVSLAVNRVCPRLDGNGEPYNVEDCKDFAWAGARPQMRRAIDLARSGNSFAVAIQISAATIK